MCDYNRNWLHHHLMENRLTTKTNTNNFSFFFQFWENTTKQFDYFLVAKDNKRSNGTHTHTRVQIGELKACVHFSSFLVALLLCCCVSHTHSLSLSSIYGVCINTWEVPGGLHGPHRHCELVCESRRVESSQAEARLSWAHREKERKTRPAVYGQEEEEKRLFPFFMASFLSSSSLRAQFPIRGFLWRIHIFLLGLLFLLLLLLLGYILKRRSKRERETDHNRTFSSLKSSYQQAAAQQYVVLRTVGVCTRMSSHFWSLGDGI